MIEEYQKQGYLVYRGLFTETEINELKEVLTRFHEAWKVEHKSFYETKAVNSAYLTGTRFLTEPDRLKLFRFVCQEKIYQRVSRLIPSGPAFMNTQLFFNPVDPQQKNYWHRDIQYNPMTIEQQKETIQRVNVIHFRIPTSDEPGMELVPGTHVRWDSDEEFEVRMEKNGKLCSDDLSTGVEISLNAGDLLVFSANMIHRGLYGGDRLTFDMLFCDRDPGLLAFVEADCLPDNSLLGKIPNSSLLAASRAQASTFLS